MCEDQCTALVVVFPYLLSLSAVEQTFVPKHFLSLVKRTLLIPGSWQKGELFRLADLPSMDGRTGVNKAKYVKTHSLFALIRQLVSQAIWIKTAAKLSLNGINVAQEKQALRI